MSTETIFALSSGRPPAAVSVIRISGPHAHAAGRQLAGRLPEARSAALRTLRAGSGEILDDALILRFDAPASSTGEDIVELQCHGGRAVVDAILEALSGIDGLRPAEPGEFTRRAFENGLIDLTEAEGLADLIEAETETQRKAALTMAEGGLRRQVEDWQQRVLQLSARAEAAIDYVDDDDVATDLQLQQDCTLLAGELGDWLERPRIEPLKDGVRVVVAGPPNVGKSSLINAIAGEDKAIVTDVPGTTRDHIEVPLALAGLPIVLTDTAGLRETDDRVEAIGVSRSRSLLDQADILLWLGEPEEAPEHPRAILVHSRADLPTRALVPEGSVPVSSMTGAGIRELLDRVRELSASFVPGENPLALNRRQAAHLADARVSIRSAAETGDLVIAAEQLRNARLAFDRLTGRASVEEVLDALFGRFCLGK